MDLWLIRHGESTWNTLGLAVLRPAGDIAVIAHGGTVRVLNAYLRHIPVERMSWEPLANGCILRSPAWRFDHTNS